MFALFDLFIAGVISAAIAITIFFSDHKTSTTLSRKSICSFF